MSLTNSELKILCDELNRVLVGGTLRRVIHFDRGRLILSIAQPDYDHNLLVCLEEPFLRVHLTRCRLRKRENSFPFGGIIARHLTGSTVENVSQLHHDRIVQLCLTGSGRTGFFLVELFRAKPNMYLLDENRFVIADWRWEATGKPYLLKPNPISPVTTPRFAVRDGDMYNYTVDREYEKTEQRAAFEERKAAVLSSLRREKKKVDRLIANLKQDAEQARDWDALKRKADLLKGSLASLKQKDSVVRVTDWATGEEITLDLDPSLTPRQNMERMFRQSKKRQRGLVRIDARIRESEHKLSTLEFAMDRATQLSDPESLEVFLKEMKGVLPSPRRAPEKAGPARTLPFRVFTSKEGLKIFVGRNDAENDALTVSFARGRDLWFHTHDCPGSHVVVRAETRAEIGRETILDAANLALYYSRGRSEGAGDVIYTQRKYITKPKSLPPGMVNVSEHRVIHIKQDEDRIRSLKQSASHAPDKESP
jgi:predicted ribosome quality control (RQC) complex YloA/Tae2 family protein